MEENKKIALAYCVTLYNVLDKILYINGSEGVEKPEERDIAFNVKYKLQRNLDVLVKDYAYYQNERTKLIKQYGEEKDNKVSVTQDNMEKFREDLLKVLSIEVEHTFKKLTPEEVDGIKGDINVNTQEMDLFIAFMVDDEDLLNDLKTDIKPSDEDK